MNARRIQTAVVVAVIGMLAIVVQGQGPKLSQTMRAKLLLAQRTLEAVVTADWSGLERHTEELERLTASPGWTVLRYPEYRTQSQAFVTALQDLRRVAGERDSGRATEAYTIVIRQCVECHRYMARARMAR